VDILDTHYAITPDGVYVAYQVMGDGPIDVVWQSDWPGNIDIEQEGSLYRIWFDELASFSRLILHDRRGIGLSSRNVPLPNLETRVSDLLMVLDAVGSEHPVLTGISESGAPNALLAATRPERVQAMVWLEPTPRCTWAPDYPWGRRLEDLEARDLRDSELWGTLAYGRAYVQGAASLGHVIPDYVVARMAKASRNACTPDVARDLAKIWNETDVRGVLSAVQVPTLILAWPERKDIFDRASYVASLIPGAELHGLPGGAWTEETMQSSAEEIRRFVGVERAPTDLDTVLSTVMFTDIVGSTERQAALGDHGWKGLIERHHAIVRETLGRYRGVENDTAGDGFFATFDGPARAIRCAQELIGRVGDLGIEIRAGIHTGECEFINEKVGGIAVTIGARISSIAGPSEILISQTVKDLVAGSGLTFGDVGQHELKGIPDRWHLYRVMGHRGLTEVGSGSV
jgi:class 3 adenylate cyclase/pimeloyl-ACP methyl ester carboxylesterase